MKLYNPNPGIYQAFSKDVDWRDRVKIRYRIGDKLWKILTLYHSTNPDCELCGGEGKIRTIYDDKEKAIKILKLSEPTNLDHPIIYIKELDSPIDCPICKMHRHKPTIELIPVKCMVDRINVLVERSDAGYTNNLVTVKYEVYCYHSYNTTKYNNASLYESELSETKEQCIERINKLAETPPEDCKVKVGKTD